MQVLIRPLAQRPLTEEEFYALGAETPRVRFAARLHRLLIRLNLRKAPPDMGLEVDHMSQTPAQAEGDVKNLCMRPVHH